MQTTVGQVLLNDGFPEDLRDYNRVFDKNSIRPFLEEVYTRYPDKYKRIIKHLQDSGWQAAQASGASVSLKDFLVPDELRADMDELRAKVDQIHDDPTLSTKERDFKVMSEVMKAEPLLEKKLVALSTRDKNSLTEEVVSGSRGNLGQLRSLLLGNFLVSDHKDRTIPSPILHGYGHGLDPAEYFAAAFGSRKGAAATKFWTQNAGFWSKIVAQTAHKLQASDEDPIEGRGLSLGTDTPDLVGYVLSVPAGDYKAGTVITPRIKQELKKLMPRVLVHSAISAVGKSHNGIPRIALGLRENRQFPRAGDNVGLTAAQALGEKIVQLQLESKHRSGLSGGAKSAGFDLINNLIQAPKIFRGGATVAATDGTVSAIEPADQGGQYVTIKDIKHYIEPNSVLTVKTGSRVEAGDPLMEGIPNPAEIVRHKGIGEARRRFVESFLSAYRNSGLPVHRRNVELLARGLINHVKINDLDALPGALPGDLVEYDELARQYKPRRDAEDLTPNMALHKYLEAPVLHYSIGTRITPSVSRNLRELGVSSVTVHRSPPPFEPVMKRAMESITTNSDPLVRFGGSYQQRSLLDAVHRGRSSPKDSASFIPKIILGDL